MTMRRCARFFSPLRMRRTCGRCCAWCAHPFCAPSTMTRCGLRDTSCSILIAISLGATPSPTYPGNRRKRLQPGASTCRVGVLQHSTRWLKGFSAAQRSTCTRIVFDDLVRRNAESGTRTVLQRTCAGSRLIAVRTPLPVQSAHGVPALSCEASRRRREVAQQISAD